MVNGGEFERQDRNNLEVFKYDAGEGWITLSETVI